MYIPSSFTELNYQIKIYDALEKKEYEIAAKNYLKLDDTDSTFLKSLDQKIVKTFKTYFFQTYIFDYLKKYGKYEIDCKLVAKACLRLDKPDFTFIKQINNKPLGQCRAYLLRTYISYYLQNNNYKSAANTYCLLKHKELDFLKKFDLLPLKKMLTHLPEKETTELNKYLATITNEIRADKQALEKHFKSRGVDPSIVSTFNDALITSLAHSLLPKK